MADYGLGRILRALRIAGLRIEIKCDRICDLMININVRPPSNEVLARLETS